jgi:hypothetical protein
LSGWHAIEAFSDDFAGLCSLFTFVSVVFQLVIRNYCGFICFYVASGMNDSMGSQSEEENVERPAKRPKTYRSHTTAKK